MALTDGKQLPLDVVHVLRRRLRNTDASGTYSLGWVPKGASIHAAGVCVRTVFNAGTGNTLDIGYRNSGDGTADDLDEYATALALTTAAVIPADEMASTAAINTHLGGAEITCTLTYSSTAPTTGDILVWVEYSVDNDTVY